ncbi:MAG: hypothetical protein Q9Q13_14685, partial [Acidobacteriota bacterium]|nr:hypothetical protein [Acidobacteriota bacterium]
PGGHRRARRLRPLRVLRPPQYFPLDLRHRLRPGLPTAPLLDLAPHQRCGRMSDYQKKGATASRRSDGKPKPQAYARALRETLDRLLVGSPRASAYALVSDDHKQYALAVSATPGTSASTTSAWPTPPRTQGKPRSDAARRTGTPPWPPWTSPTSSLRRSLSHQRRETIAFARRHSSLAEQIFYPRGVAELRQAARRAPARAGTRAMHAEAERPALGLDADPRPPAPALRGGPAADLGGGPIAAAPARFPSHLEVKPHDLKNAF